MDSAQVEQFRQNQLNQINGYRYIHGSNALVLDSGVCRDAQAWAEYLAATETITHQTGTNYGENIAWGYPISSLNPAEMWYSEVRDIDSYDNLDSNSGCYHFSQVVWRSSQTIGIGMAESSNGAWYIVAKFEPRGNVIGSFRENVFPPQH